MGWSTHRTTEMPAVPPPVGRHRKSRISRIGIGAALVLVGVAVTAAMVSPELFGGSSGTTTADTTTRPPALDALASPTAARTAAPASPSPKPPRATKPPAAAPPAASPLASFEDSVIALVNAVRAEKGCRDLRNDPKLHSAARAHSMEMARYQYHSHTGRDGSDPGERMRAAGYDVKWGWAENIARGYPTPATVMAGWMGSRDHRANILNCDLRAIGVGAARVGRGDIYWTQDFGGR